jgi:hypothetical protein
MGIETSRKGCLAEAVIVSEFIRRGCRVLKPLDAEARYDLVVEREGKFERIQCKYTQSDEDLVTVKCRSGNAEGDRPYQPGEIDWIAVYDNGTNTCYFVNSDMLGPKGRQYIYLRLSPPKNGQKKGILWAKDFTAF